jgi:hypothetical protein
LCLWDIMAYSTVEVSRRFEGTRIRHFTPIHSHPFEKANSYRNKIVIQGGAEKRENVKLTMRFRPVVKFLLHVGS